MKKYLLRLYVFLSSQMGIDIRKLLYFFLRLPRFLSDLYLFQKNNYIKTFLVPFLHDKNEENGATKSEYFWQDLLIAQMIRSKNPQKHVDIGSRIDGFVAHVASFRDIEVFDIRPIKNKIPGVTFRQADLTKIENIIEESNGYCDSLSCLHALEHFGLGRYGDEVNVFGAEEGFKNMIKLLIKGATFYLSVPIGIERVEFNANRVFDPRFIIKMSQKYKLSLKSLITITSEGIKTEIDLKKQSLNELSKEHYNLGVFIFEKL